MKLLNNKLNELVVKLNGLVVYMVISKDKVTAHMNGSMKVSSKDKESVIKKIHKVLEKLGLDYKVEVK